MNGRVMIFEGHQAGRPDVDQAAYLYCSNSGWAFGPPFDSADDCTEFLAWLEKEKGEELDPRRLPTRELYDLHVRWLAETRRVT